MESPYARYTAERDKSARQARGLQERDDRKRLREVERMPNVESLHEYLQASEASGREGSLAARIPDLRDRKELCRNFFLCNVWEAEPHLLDDLQAAEASGDTEAVHKIREMIRAASWASHGRTDGDVAARLARKELERMQKEAAAYRKQGLELWQGALEKHTRDLEMILEALAHTACNEQAEEAVLAIEQLVFVSWEEFIDSWKHEREKNPKLPWPDRGVKFPKALQEHADRLTHLRQIRDQLYYQRLYSQLCRIAFKNRQIKT